MNFQNKKAIYLQIADYICEQVLLEKWQACDKIPSVRELAVQLEVNPNTVMRTYAFLQEKNIITIQRGIGYFVAESAYQQAIEFKKEEFFKDDLPLIFHSMALLKLSFSDLQKYYDSMNHKMVSGTDKAV